MVKRRQLRLVAFARDWCRESLYTAVQGLGYKVNVVDGAAWVKQGAASHTKPTILLLNSKNCPSAELLSLLKEDTRFAVLGVCCRADRHWDVRLLRLCSEFLGWPCHEHELAMRLRHTFGDPQVQADAVDETVFLQQFVDLNLLGRSPVFVEALKLIKKFALCEAPVLIEGETGTGKELASRAIHYLSARRDHAFTPVNCGAIPENLIENELFGHEKGAFTDAKENQPGLVAEARGGTLFLDEVDTLSEKAQIALLRFLENQEYRSLGCKKTKKTNVRIITATNASLPALVEKGLFRRDLFYRLHVLFIELPPLRERGSDIKLLAEYFIRQYSAQYRQPDKRLSPKTSEWMMRYPWPGNVRELDNLLHKEFFLGTSSTISIREQRAGAQKPSESVDNESMFPAQANLKELKLNAIATFEKDYLCWLMEETKGNISLAARQSGTQRSALRRLLGKHGIDKSIWCNGR